MTFIRGNKAIRDHIQDGKALYLFEYKRPGHVEFIGEMLCHSHRIQNGKDKNGESRKIIVFELTRKPN